MLKALLVLGLQLSTAEFAPAIELQHGFCDTASQGHDCLKGTKGSWPSCAISNLSQSSNPIARPHEVSLQTSCLRACLECPRCKYISFSEQWGDCSWFHVCDLSQLRSDVPGFHTMQVRGMGGKQRVWVPLRPLSRSPRARLAVPEGSTALRGPARFVEQPVRHRPRHEPSETARSNCAFSWPSAVGSIVACS